MKTKGVVKDEIELEACLILFEHQGLIKKQSMNNQIYFIIPDDFADRINEIITKNDNGE